MDAALGAVALGCTLAFGLDGSWLGCVLRVLVVGALTALGMRLVSRGSRGAVAVMALATGTVATPVGSTLSVRYLGTDDWSVRAPAGVLMAAGGVVLLAAGFAGLAASLRGWRRLAIVPAGVLVLVIAMPLTISVAATNVPRPDLGTETPTDRGLEYVEATFTTADGVQLSGWYIPSLNGAAVVMPHGATSTRTSVLDQAAVLARHGYGVLLFDARGMGRSGGRAMNLGWYGDRDLAAAIDYLEARPDVDPSKIAAVGESMGGEEAIGAIGRDPRLRAVVAEGATNRVAGDWGWLPQHYGVRGTIQQGINVVTFAADRPVHRRGTALHAAGRGRRGRTSAGAPDRSRRRRRRGRARRATSAPRRRAPSRRGSSQELTTPAACGPRRWSGNSGSRTSWPER